MIADDKRGVKIEDKPLEIEHLSKNTLVMQVSVADAELPDGTPIHISELMGAALMVQIGDGLENRYTISYNTIVQQVMKYHEVIGDGSKRQDQEAS